MIAKEASANFAALAAFDSANRRKQSRQHAVSLAAQVWLSHQPRADARQACAVAEELAAEATNCEGMLGRE
jgi:hypothetical protein